MHSPFLHHCLSLAENARGAVSPNPLVGCVIVKGGAMITEGFHKEFGSEHAEVIALKKAGDLARGATLYVNLEPCKHEGKQPPCTDAIIRFGIATVVFGARDKENGGSADLESNGIEVIGPMMEAECRRQNRGFFSLQENGRPWVTIKKAMRRDGSITGKITNEGQDEWSHTHLRAMHDAILVGSGTVVEDDPSLTVRHGTPHYHPRRILLDPHNEVPPTAKVLTDSDSSRTLVIHEKLPIPELLEQLKDEGIASVLVEGGPKVWESFEKSGCVDEVVVLVGTKN